MPNDQEGLGTVAIVELGARRSDLANYLCERRFVEVGSVCQVR